MRSADGKKTRSKPVRYLSDPAVGSVSGSTMYQLRSEHAGNVEGSYRSIYRMLRVANPNSTSTPIGEGEIQRSDAETSIILTQMSEETIPAPPYASVEKGLRAINADNVVFFDPAPPAWRARFRQKIRRGQHVLQAFLNTRDSFGAKGVFSKANLPHGIFHLRHQPATLSATPLSDGSCDGNNPSSRPTS